MSPNPVFSVECALAQIRHRLRQFHLSDLLRAIPREIIDVRIVQENLEGGQPARAMLDQFFRRHLLLCLLAAQANVDLDLLHTMRVGNSDGSRLLYVGMLAQRCLQFVGCDVFSASLDRFLDPADDRNIPIVIHRGENARAKPIAMERSAVCPRLLVGAPQDARSLYTKLSDGSSWQFSPSRIAYPDRTKRRSQSTGTIGGHLTGLRGRCMYQTQSPSCRTHRVRPPPIGPRARRAPRHGGNTKRCNATRCHNRSRLSQVIRPHKGRPAAVWHQPVDCLPYARPRRADHS